MRASRLRLAIVTVGAAALLAGPAAAKMPQLRFATPSAEAGSSVAADVRGSWVGTPFEKFRYFLVHVRDLDDLFPPHRVVRWGRAARKAAADDRLAEVDVTLTGDAADKDGRPVDVALPEGLRRGRYTTAVMICNPGCVLAPALTAPALDQLDRDADARRVVLRIRRA